MTEADIYAGNLETLKRVSLTPLLHSLLCAAQLIRTHIAEEKAQMQITQAQLDAITAEETDLAASVANAVTRSQAAQTEVATMEGHIADMTTRLQNAGQPVDLTAINGTLTSLKAQIDGIAAPGIVVPAAPPAPTDPSAGPVAGVPASPPDNASAPDDASAPNSGGVQIPGTSAGTDGNSSVSVGDKTQVPSATGGGTVDGTVTAVDGPTGVVTATPDDPGSTDDSPPSTTPENADAATEATTSAPAVTPAENAAGSAENAGSPAGNAG